MPAFAGMTERGMTFRMHRDAEVKGGQGLGFRRGDETKAVAFLGVMEESRQSAYAGANVP